MVGVGASNLRRTMHDDSLVGEAWKIETEPTLI
jgi:hypothetical protein